MARAPRKRVRIGTVWIDAVTFDEALAEICALRERGQGGSIFTPNVDHVVNAWKTPHLTRVYADASLSLVDGVPLLWAARILGTPLPEKISGSDLTPRLFDLALERGWRVFLVGGAEGVADETARILGQRGVQVVGVDASFVKLEGDPSEEALVERLVACKPDLVIVALGAPKQEYWIERIGPRIKPAICAAVGASLDFVTGRVSRAPRWMQRSGLEWLHRLASDPRRLAYRYLVNDPQIARVVFETWRAPRESRVRVVEREG